MNVLAFLSLLSVFISFFLGNMIYNINPKNEMNRIMMFLCYLNTIWAFSDYHLYQFESYAKAQFWLQVSDIWPFISSLIYHFTMVFTEKLKTRRYPFSVILMHMLALVMMIIDLNSNLFGGEPVKTAWGWTYSMPENGFVFAFSIFWIFGIIFIMLIITIDFHFKTKSEIKKYQSKYIIIGLSIPLAVAFLTEYIFGVFKLEYPGFTSPSLVVGYAAIIIGLKRKKSYILTPEIAAEDIFSSMSNFLIIVDQNGLISDINKAGLKLLKYKHSEIINRPLELIFPTQIDLKKSIMPSRRTLGSRTGQINNQETVFKNKNGESVSVLLSMSIMFDKKGQQLGLICVGSDLTYYKLVNKRLYESEEKYLDLLENANDLVQSVAPDGHFIYVNKAWRDALGYDFEEIKTLKMFDIIAAEQYEHCAELFHLVLSGEKVEKIETIFIAKDGTHIFVEGSANCRFIDGKPFATRGIFRDVTHRKRIEKELKEKECWYHMATQAGKVGVWDWNLKTNEIYLDPNLKQMLGYEVHEIRNHLDHWGKLIHPDDQERVHAELDNYIKGSTDEFQSEHRMMRKDGTICWILARGTIVRDEKNTARRMFGTDSDITDLKIADDALKAVHNSLEERVKVRTLELEKSNNLLQKEISEHKKTAKKLAHSVKDLTFISETAMGFVALSERDDIYKFIADKLRLLVNKAFIIVNSYDPETNLTRTETIHGLGKYSTGILKLLGRNPVGMQYELNDAEAYETLLQRKLIQIQGGIHRLSFGAIPQATSRAIEKLANIGEIWGMGMTFQDKIFGNIIIIARTGTRLTNIETIETFINQAAVALKRRQAEEQISAALKEKDILLKEIHHRVKNNLQIISSLIYLQSKTIKDPETLHMFIESQNRVKSMALIHETLYKSHDLSQIDFEEYIRDLINHLFRLYEVDTRRIQKFLKIEKAAISIDNALACGMIINELVSNSLKYAFSLEGKGKISISFIVESRNNYTLVVQDNGIGLPAGFNIENTDSLGLRLVNTLTSQLHGKLTITNNNGVSFRISFSEPKSKEVI